MDNINFIEQFEKVARAYPFRSPPILVAHPVIGPIGKCYPGEGFRFKGMTSREWNALLKDERRARNLLFNRLFNQRGAITTWDGVLNARANGKADDRFFTKSSQTTVAYSWSSFYRSGGVPPAGSYTNIPGGAVHTQDSTGAFQFIAPNSDKKYLLNFGVQHLSGTNVVMLVDLLVAAGNISANSTSSQTVNSTAQTRTYGSTLGEGVFPILEVTTALGATASNFTLTSYTNQAGTTGRASAAIAMTASCIVYRLQPVATAPIITLQSGDYGVRSVETVSFSAAMGSGVVALLLYRPLLLIPTITNTTYIERTTPAMLGGIIELVKDASNKVGCLTVFVLTSSTSTGVQTYFVQSCAG